MCKDKIRCGNMTPTGFSFNLLPTPRMNGQKGEGGLILKSTIITNRKRVNATNRSSRQYSLNKNVISRRAFIIVVRLYC